MALRKLRTSQDQPASHPRGPHNSRLFIDAVVGQGHQRLATPMPCRVAPGQDQVADCRVGDDVLDDLTPLLRVPPKRELWEVLAG
jgi:hypothetical protein